MNRDICIKSKTNTKLTNNEHKNEENTFALEWFFLELNVKI